VASALLLSELQRVSVVHDKSEAQRTCPCATAVVEIGQDASAQFDFVLMPARALR